MTITRIEEFDLTKLTAVFDADLSNFPSDVSNFVVNGNPATSMISQIANHCVLEFGAEVLSDQPWEVLVPGEIRFAGDAQLIVPQSGIVQPT